MIIGIVEKIVSKDHVGESGRNVLSLRVFLHKGLQYIYIYIYTLYDQDLIIIIINGVTW